MKRVVILMGLITVLTACKGNSDNNKLLSQNISKTQKEQKDTINPDVDIKVNKTYDKNGNVVRFDSTYTYFYKSPEMDLKGISADSLFDKLSSPLNLDYNALMRKNMDSVFFNDTLMKYDFLNPNYFSKRFELNMPKFQNMFREMDSLKSRMLQKNYPQGHLKSNK
jgi:hypothetical protein